jgi:hypothetical protein
VIGCLRSIHKKNSCLLLLQVQFSEKTSWGGVMDEAQLLQQFALVRDSSMMMISIQVSILFAYLAALYLVLSERGVFERLFVYLTAFFAFAFFILNFGLPLRKEINALIEDMESLKHAGAELSASSTIIINPCTDIYFEFLRSLTMNGGECVINERVYMISDFSTVTVWILLLLITIINPWRKRSF